MKVMNMMDFKKKILKGKNWIFKQTKIWKT